MTIVELPDCNEGFLHLEVDNHLIAMLWIDARRTRVSPMEDGRWIINLDNCERFIYADAIRRK